MRRLGWALGAAGAVALYAHDPVRSPLLPACPLHALTGLDCPLCGTTRAMHELLHAHAATAFGLNPLIVLALPFFLWFAARGRAPRLPQWGVLGAGLVFGVLRNLPFAAFAWMGT